MLVTTLVLTPLLVLAPFIGFWNFGALVAAVTRKEVRTRAEWKRLGTLLFVVLLIGLFVSDPLGVLSWYFD